MCYHITALILHADFMRYSTQETFHEALDRLQNEGHILSLGLPHALVTQIVWSIQMDNLEVVRLYHYAWALCNYHASLHTEKFENMSTINWKMHSLCFSHACVVDKRQK